MWTEALMIPLALTAAPGDSVAGIPEEVLEQPIPIREELTRVRHPVETDTPEARTYHEQGLSFLHLFGYIEAARSFNAALERDPTLAPAKLGLALSYQQLGDGDAAEAAAERAAEMAEDAPEGDRAYVELRGRPLLDPEALDGEEDGPARLREEVDEALDEHPGNLELQVFRAQLKSGEEEISAFHRILEDAPDHVGVHHYLVHRYEHGAETVDLAVAHGNVLSALAGASAHGRHMYGHNLRKVGRVDEAIQEFEAADSIERHLDRAEGIPREHDWHHPHNLNLLGMSYLHQGRVAEAEAIFRDLAGLPAAEPQQAMGGHVSHADFHLARGEWSQVRDVAKRIEAVDHESAHVLALAFRGLTKVAEGDLDGARALQEEADGMEDKLPGFLGFHVDALAAFAEAEAHEPPELQEILEGLKGQQGPDAWARSHLHMSTLARLAHSREDAATVGKVAEALQVHDEGYAGGYYWEARAARLDGEAPDSDALHRASSLWENADPELPELEALERWAHEDR